LDQEPAGNHALQDAVHNCLGNVELAGDLGHPEFVGITEEQQEDIGHPGGTFGADG
jgi:hypothetical protein